ncbi:hypothetical protein [Alteromonas sp. M12]|uniref:hypothetical protein n=1 Tax=Alteromonas sp. M12 TaxID=3135644 RepID=UPI00319E7986
MGEIFKQNSINLVVSSSAILCAYHIGLGNILFWFGGLLVVPAIAIWFQFKYALGNFIVRLNIAVLPWLVLCFVGLFWVSKTEHVGQRTMNMFFFEMPIYSVVVGAVVVTGWFFFQKANTQS